MGCFFQVKVFILGLTLLATLINIPTLAAAVLAATEEKTADLPLMSLILGNCIALAFGFALPWIIGSIYWEINEKNFAINPGLVTFGLDQLLGMSIVAFIILLGRRLSCCGGGELGGNIVCKILITIIFFCLWIILIGLVSIVQYGIVEPWFSRLL